MLKNADQAFMAGVFCLILQKSCFLLIFSIFSKLGPNAFWIPAIFYFQLLWLKKPRIIIITFINFRTLKAICVWTTTWIDLKFSGHLQGIKIYSQKYGFLMSMFWLKVMTQNPSKPPFFQSFSFWSLKYTHYRWRHQTFFRNLIWRSILKTFAKFHWDFAQTRSDNFLNNIDKNLKSKAFVALQL